MSNPTRYPTYNPRLGTLFSIFTSAIVGAIVLLIMFERLGLSRFWISHIASIAPLFFAAVVGLFSISNNTSDLYASGRRVPPSFSGFNLAITALGGTGLLSLTGLFFLIGFDAVSLSLGWCLGFVLMALLYAPNIRRAGAYSLPGFFSERFKSRSTGTTCALLMMPPLLMVLIAEMKVASFAAFLITGVSQEVILSALTLLILLVLIPGGMRSLTWSGAASFIILLVGFLVPLFIVSIYLTNIPIPQLTYGALLDDLTKYEITNGLSVNGPIPIDSALGTNAPQSIERMFLQSFGTLSGTDFTMLMLCVLCGVATFPTLLTRSITAKTPHDARRATGWGLALLGVFLISAPAYAVFVKYMIFQNLIGATIDQLPEWARNLVNLRLLEIRDQDQNASLGIKELYVTRDGLTFILPIIAGLPFALIVMTVTSALAASAAAAAAQTFTLAMSVVRGFSSRSLSEDTFYTSNHVPLRISIAIIALLGAIGAITVDADTLWLLVWALSISASTFFAPVSLAIFWKRFTASGAIVSMLVGMTLSIAYILLSPEGQGGLLSGINHLVAGVIGIPASFAAAIIVSSFGTSKNDVSALSTESMSGQSQYALHGATRNLANQPKN